MASLTLPISPGMMALLASRKPPWSRARKSWVSKPPSDTMNTWRLAPRVLRALMRRATILSWSASELPLGKAKVVAVVLASAVVTAPSEAMERAATLVYSFSSLCVPVCCTRARRAVVTALEP